MRETINFKTSLSCSFKEMADVQTDTLKARGLYAEMMDFPIFFLVEGCCNNKPTLSSTDGGISRRVGIIHYPVQFLENPDPNNEHEALLKLNLNLKMGQIHRYYKKYLCKTSY